VLDSENNTAASSVSFTAISLPYGGGFPAFGRRGLIVLTKVCGFDGHVDHIRRCEIQSMICGYALSVFVIESLHV
jgi:hypothetical protein